MQKEQVKAFLIKHSLSETELAEVLGVKKSCVNHWINGRRSVSLTVARLIRMFDAEPDLMKVFVA